MSHPSRGAFQSGVWRLERAVLRGFQSLHLIGVLRVRQRIGNDRQRLNGPHELDAEIFGRYARSRNRTSAHL
jgi:hypothetical protein